MSNSRKDPFDQIQQQANVNPDQIYKVAESVKNADFSDETTVRALVQRLAKIAGKPISKAKEDKIVQSITENNMPIDMQSLNQLFKK
ncbi:sporulation-specific transcription regulator SopVIF [Virgibacillus siamensis]|uniref:Sporulation-specific transcription regulator SopVIF n=1 Tax=Virgibacillus siamensis TaxID=480071 RepID=A0ABN1FXC8_9BACI